MEEENEEEIWFVNHFSLWRRKREEEIRFVNHFSLLRRKMRKKSGLLPTSLIGGVNDEEVDQVC